MARSSITPGQPYGYDIDLWSTSLIFNKGHQIRVAISSSNSPRFQPNPNTGGPWPFDPKVKPVVAHLTDQDMVDLTANIVSLQP